MRARTHYAAHNLSVLKQLTLNLIRLNPAPRKGGIKVQRLIASTSDSFRSQLLALVGHYDNGIHAIALWHEPMLPRIMKFSSATRRSPLGAPSVAFGRGGEWQAFVLCNNK
jgi:hypothetical protein